MGLLIALFDVCVVAKLLGTPKNFSKNWHNMPVKKHAATYIYIYYACMYVMYVIVIIIINYKLHFTLCTSTSTTYYYYVLLATSSSILMIPILFYNL